VLLVLIGAGEEVFWRHHLQRQLHARWGAAGAIVLQAVLYAGAHAVSGNPTLVAAAFTAGLFWGTTYALWRSPAINIVSHVVWDIAVFLVFPLA
jgi:membrane protease YdiL (CAAX protease family)